MKPGTRLLAIALALLLFALALAWWFAGSVGIVSSSKLFDWIQAVRGEPWAPLFVFVAFLIAGLTAFPIHALVLATAAVYGPWNGFIYSAIGSFTCALAPYFLGAYLGKAGVLRLLGSRIEPVLRSIRQRGVLVVVGFRLVPVAPGTFVNLGLGASGIRPLDFLVGSAIGMLPGLIVVTLLGDRLLSALNNPKLADLAVVLGLIAIYGLTVFGAQAFVSGRRRG